tara:strand:+ start:3911 stop:8236 length:4326 start_codon:yes stop_codon:yes gene_type:complete
MAGYTRQSSADIVATAVVRANPLNLEFNTLRDAFTLTSGHKHDGSSTEGGYVPLIADSDGLNKIVIDTSNNRVGVFVEVSNAAVEQIRIQDGAIVPVTNTDIDLGTSTLEFKDLFLDGTAHIDTLDVDVNATVTGTLGVTGTGTFSNALSADGTTLGTLTVTGATALNGGLTMDTNKFTVADGTGNVGIAGTLAVTGTSAFTGEVTADAGISVDNITINGTEIDLSSGDLTLDVAGDIILNTDDGIVSLQDDTATFGSLENNSGNLNIKSGTTLAATFSGANVDLAGTLDVTSAATLDSTLAVAGILSPATHVDMPDNAKIKLGTDDDMTLYHDDTNGYITNSTGALKVATETSGTAVTIGHTTSEVTIGDNLTVAGNLTVSGTQTVVDTVTMNAANAIVFEGASADDYETTLSIVNPTADHTYYLPDLGGTDDVGYLAAFEVDPGTSGLISSTPDELNILDGNTSAASITLADADRVVVNDDGTMKQVALTDFETYMETSLDTLSNVTTVGALNSGSITSGFGAIDNGSSAITTTGTINFGNLDDGTITATGFVDEDNMVSNSATLIPTQQSVKAYVDTELSTSYDVSGLIAEGSEINTVADPETAVGTTAIVGGDSVVTQDISANVMRQTTVDTLDTYLAATTKTLTNKTLGSGVKFEGFLLGGTVNQTGPNALVTQGTVAGAVGYQTINYATNGSNDTLSGQFYSEATGLEITSLRGTNSTEYGKVTIQQGKSGSTTRPVFTANADQSTLLYGPGSGQYAPLIRTTDYGVDFYGDELFNSRDYSTNTPHPPADPTLRLDFANTKTLDPRLIFNRASIGTYFSRDTTKQNENIFHYSQSYIQSYWTKTNCSAANNTTTAPDGTTTAGTITRTDTTATDHGIKRIITIKKLYATVSIFAKKGTEDILQILFDGNTDYWQNFNLTNGTLGTGSSTIVNRTILDVGDGWYRCTLTGSFNTTSATAVKFSIKNAATDGRAASINPSGNDDTIFLWGAQLETTNKTTAQSDYRTEYFPTTSESKKTSMQFIKTAINNEPRFDYNPLSNYGTSIENTSFNYDSKGLMIEEARTNLITYSSDLSNAAWLKGNVTVESNAAMGLDGIISADKLAENTVNTTHYLSSPTMGPLTSGEPYTASVYVRGGQKTRLIITSTNTNTWPINSMFTGSAITSSTLGSATVTEVGGGWRRYTVTGVVGVEQVIRLKLQFTETDSNTTTSYAGNDYKGLYIWGVQVEKGLWASSYIPTVASAVTRAKETLELTEEDYFSSITASATVIAEAVPFEVVSTESNDDARVFTLCHSDDGTTVNTSSITLGRTANNYKGRMYAYGAEQFTYATDGQGDGGFLTNNLAIKSLFSWEEEENNSGGEATVGANGEVNYNFSDSVGIFPECNRLIIGGHNGSTGGTWNGTILRLSFYPPAYLDFQAHLGEVPYLTKRVYRQDII